MEKLISPPRGSKQWRWIVINSSGGKDSQTALRRVVQLCDNMGISRDRIVVSHQDLGEMEWEGTRELAERQAKHYGIRFEVSRYRNKEGDEMTLLDYVRRRKKWPDSKNRFCTSEFKRGPGGRVITKLSREGGGAVLNVFGFRASESPARAKKRFFARNNRFSTQSREVWDWLPIHDWTDDQVWDDIKASGVDHHPAYDLGMPRLSCRFCIFAPRDALLLAGINNPGLLDEYCELETEIGHTFQNGRSIISIRDAIDRGEKPKNMDGNWNM